MIIMDNTQFEGNEFALQIIAKGGFIDTGQPDKAYAVEATIIRLNHIALNEWLSSEMFNSRNCYIDGPEGDAEWEAHKAVY